MKKIILAALVAANVVVNIYGALCTMDTVADLCPKHVHSCGQSSFCGQWDHEYDYIEVFGYTIRYNYKDNLE